jgi:hypothetical protein
VPPVANPRLLSDSLDITLLTSTRGLTEAEIAGQFGVTAQAVTRVRSLNVGFWREIRSSALHSLFQTAFRIRFGFGGLKK